MIESWMLGLAIGVISVFCLVWVIGCGIKETWEGLHQTGEEDEASSTALNWEEDMIRAGRGYRDEGGGFVLGKPPEQKD